MFLDTELQKWRGTQRPIIYINDLIIFWNAVQEIQLKSTMYQHTNMSVEKLKSRMGEEWW